MKRFYKYVATTVITVSLMSAIGQTANAATSYQRLTHNAYAYNYNGQCANKKLYHKGSRVKVIGTIELNGKKYNIISGNIYIKVSNFAKHRSRFVLTGGYETSLVRNSHVYNSNGQRIKGIKLRKGHSITYYGKPVKINGKKYVQIGNNHYVRSSNVLLAYDGPISSNTNKHTNSSTSSQSSSTNSQQNNINNNSSNSISNTVNNSSSTVNGSNGSNTSNQSSNTNQGDNNTSNSQANKSNTATDADFNALTKAIEKARLVTNSEDATFAKRKAYDDALDAADAYMQNRNTPNYPISSADIQKVISDLNAATAGLDANAENKKIPNIYVKDGKPEWTPGLEKQVLEIVNEKNGSINAHFIDGTNNAKVGYTDGNNMVYVESSEEYYHSIEINDDTGKPWGWQPSY